MTRTEYHVGGNHHEVPLSRKTRPPPPSPPSASPDSHSTSSAKTPRNRRILPIDDATHNEAPGPVRGGGGEDAGTKNVVPPYSGMSTGNTFGFTLGGYILTGTGLNHGINWMASFMPVRWVIGKQPDDLTQRGIAHLMLIGVLLILAAFIILYIGTKFIRKRRGVYGRLRRIMLIHHFGDPHLYGGKERNPLFWKGWVAFRHWIYRFVRSTGLYRFLGNPKRYADRLEKRKKKI